MGTKTVCLPIDASWDLPVTVENLRKMCNKMGVKMYVEKLDWEEMRQMQVAFFKAGFFVEGYWNIKRFGHDVRIAWLSSLVMTGEKTREEALKELEQLPLTEEEEQRMFKEIAKKLEIS